MTSLNNILPSIVDEQCIDNTRELSVEIPHDLYYFNGHFAQAPILAGVVQLHWAVELLKEKFKLGDVAVKDVEVLKFKVVIVPGQKLLLTLSKKTSGKYTFNYVSDKGQHSSGRILFKEIQ